jgi:hypothetical protein
MLWLTAVAVPLVAGVITAVTYCLPEGDPWRWVNDIAVPIGLAGGFSLWLLAAGLSRRAAHARYANAESFDAINKRLHQLLIRLKSCHMQPDAAISTSQTAYDEAQESCAAITEKLASSGGLQWVKGTGYIEVWNLIYLAEEALIEFEPEPMVVSGALHDESRIRNSTIDNREELLDTLRIALCVLNPDAARYLDKAPLGSVQAVTAATGTDSVQASADDDRKLSARAALREVRYAVDKFRGQRWSGAGASAQRPPGDSVGNWACRVHAARLCDHRTCASGIHPRCDRLFSRGYGGRILQSPL